MSYGRYKQRQNRKRWCNHMNDRGRSEIHYGVRRWLDTARRRWVEDECKRCGRLWRSVGGRSVS